MTDRELMQQALEALLEVNYDQVYAKEVAALRKRLAQPEQEPVAKVRHDLEGHIGWNPKLTQLPDEGAPLYTSPPASKPWVGLTDEDVAETCGFGEYTTTSTRMTLTHLARAIEAKLREKNA